MKKLNKVLITGGICLTSGALLSVAGFGTEPKVNQNDKIEFDRIEVIEMTNTIEDILEWQEYDRERGETGMGSHEEGWGSNYWLTEMKNDLYLKLFEGEDRYEIDCENCDEID